MLEKCLNDELLQKFFPSSNEREINTKATDISIEKASNDRQKPSEEVSYKKYIVAIAQTATKVVQKFDYDSLLQILPALASYEDVRASVDALQRRLLPLYESELKDQLNQYHPEVQLAQSLIERSVIYGEKLILESDQLAAEIAKFQKKPNQSEPIEVLTEAENKDGEVREILKTHTWKELSDKF